MQATYSSETSVDFQQTTRRYIPEDRTIHTTAVRNSNPKYVPLIMQFEIMTYLNEKKPEFAKKTYFSHLHCLHLDVYHGIWPTQQ
jgi:hypothetical protein